MYNFMLYFLLRTSTGEGGRERVETLILASKSPRRHELIRHMNLPFTAEDADVDEHVAGTPQDVVLTLAQRKAQAVSGIGLSGMCWVRIPWYTPAGVLGSPAMRRTLCV